MRPMTSSKALRGLYFSVFVLSEENSVHCYRRCTTVTFKVFSFSFLSAMFPVGYSEVSPGGLSCGTFCIASAIMIAYHFLTSQVNLVVEVTHHK